MPVEDLVQRLGKATSPVPATETPTPGHEVEADLHEGVGACGSPTGPGRAARPRASSAGAVSTEAVPWTRTLQPVCVIGSKPSTSKATTAWSHAWSSFALGAGADQDAVGQQREVDGQDDRQGPDRQRQATDGRGSRAAGGIPPRSMRLESVAVEGHMSIL